MACEHKKRKRGGGLKKRDAGGTEPGHLGRSHQGKAYPAVFPNRSCPTGPGDQPGRGP